MDMIETLSKSSLFIGLSPDEIKSSFEYLDKNYRGNYFTKKYFPNDYIAIEGYVCENLGIIMDGEIEVQRELPSGKFLTITGFKSGDVFAESIIFSKKNVYPSTIVSITQSEVLFISKTGLLKLMSKNEKLFENFARILSERIHLLSDRVTTLSLDTTRKKIANLLIKEYKKTSSLNVELPYGREKMAQMLNVTRPSLSRELTNMKDEGLIDYYKSKFTILDLNSLEDCLL
ncbi:MAG: Crp/Fnr family transcriptional regulator [Tissierellales bacterium]|nr:Crp/Fnr family transcriptional regulator [Tissierellales bacterium]